MIKQGINQKGHRILITLNTLPNNRKYIKENNKTIF